MQGLFLITSCEKAEIQKSLVTTNGKVQAREDDCVDDCEDCPVNDCCCAITLLSNTEPAGLVLCGTTGPCVSERTCDVDELDLCEDIEGFELDIALLNQFSTVLFCVPENTPFGIISSDGTHLVRITCQLGQTNPQSVIITLNSPPAKPYWETNGSCELTSCFN